MKDSSPLYRMELFYNWMKTAFQLYQRFCVQTSRKQKKHSKPTKFFQAVEISFELLYNALVYRQCTGTCRQAKESALQAERRAKAGKPRPWASGQSPPGRSRYRTMKAGRVCAKQGGTAKQPFVPAKERGVF